MCVCFVCSEVLLARTWHDKNNFYLNSRHDGIVGIFKVPRMDRFNNVKHDAAVLVQCLCDEVELYHKHGVGCQKNNLFPLKVPVVNPVTHIN